MTDVIQSITSEQNPKFKLWQSLLTTKNRKKESLFILSGEKIIADFFSSNGPEDFPIKAILVSKNHGGDTISTLKKQWEIEDNRLFFTLDTLLFKEIDSLGTDFPLLVCQRPDDVVIQALPAPVGLELGLPLTDPSNLGALCRTAVSFNILKIYLTKGSCDPYHPKALRASSGATLKLNITHIHLDSMEHLQPHDFCLDLDGQSLYDFRWPKDIRLWLGEEGQGFKRTFRTQNKLSIPISRMESLNATVAGSIAIFSYSQRFNKL